MPDYPEHLRWKTDQEHPPVSAMCLTYGRVRVLEEAMACFLAQDYPGQKEMIILNDLPEQTLKFDHPEVTVVNVKKRFKTVGDKRNACAALASHDLLLPWDDDDIYLKHRISFSVRQMKETGLPFFKPQTALAGERGKIKSLLTSFNLHASACFTRELFAEIRGYPSMGSGQDQGFEVPCRKLGLKTSISIKPEDNFYFYRWADVKIHLSLYHLLETQETQRTIQQTLDRGERLPQTLLNSMKYSPEDEVRKSVLHAIDQGREPSGVVELKPALCSDYQAMRDDFFARRAAEQAEKASE